MDRHRLQHTVRDLLEADLERLGFDLVAVEWLSGRASPILRLSIEAPGGISAENCARVSRHVSPLLDDADPTSGRYTLEVSSPGIQRPVQRPADFDRFQGYKVRIRLSEGPPRRRYTGIIGPVEEGELRLSIDGEEHRIALDLIERAHLVLNLDEYQQLAEGEP